MDGRCTSSWLEAFVTVRPSDRYCMTTSSTPPPSEAVLATLRAVLDRMVPADGYLSATEAGVDGYLLRHAEDDFAPRWAEVLAGLANLEAQARERFGLSFVSLSGPEQDEVLAVAGQVPPVAQPGAGAKGWLDLLASWVAEAYYAGPGSGSNPGGASWEMIGYRHPLPAEAFHPGRLPRVLRSSADVAGRYDVVVVGAGAGGGTAAYVLARAGLKVLVVERGKALAATDVPTDHLRNHRLPLYGVNTGPPAEGNPRVLVTPEGEQVLRPYEEGWNNNAMALGGGTRVWGAQAWRMSPTDFKMASTYGVPDASSLADWPISYEDLEPYYCQVEWALGVAGQDGHAHMGQRSRPYPMAPFPLGRPGQLLAAGAARLGWPTAAPPLMVNTSAYGGRPACVRCSQCVGFACPVDAKGGPFNSVLVDAVGDHGCAVLVEARVVRVLVGEGGRATGVVIVDEDGTGPARRVLAGAVVLSAGAIETARLLLLSELGGPSVGANLQGHTYVGAFGLFSEPVVDCLGPGPDVATCRWLHGNDGIVGGGMLANEFVRIPAHFWHTALPPEVPRWGLANKVAMRDGYRRTLHVMGPVQEVPSPSAKVALDPSINDHLGLPVARLSGEAHPEDVRTARFLSAKALEWVEAAGAARTWAWPRPRAKPRLSAGQHQAGTCRMGEGPATSVCDPTGALHSCQNVVIADASAHVTNGGVNPALTAMALAWRNADLLARRL